jgi:hypothetical protein
MNAFFQFTYAPGAPLGLWFTHLLTETSTRNGNIMFLRSRARSVLKADNITAICEPVVLSLDNVGSSTSHNPIGLHCLLRG